MRQFFIFLFLVVMYQTNYGQAIIKGTIKDENGNPVAYASAALLLASDSTLVRGSLSDDDGNYIIEQVKEGNYRILASYLGYDNVYSDAFELKPENRSATVDINFLQKGIVLEEAIIIAKRPFLEQKSDRLVVNVANSAIAAGGTAMEILQKVPGVVITQEKVTMGGSQNLQVWVDGKPSPYTDMNALLRDMPGDQIDKIELITQPGAAFDAAGGPILNVVLKRNADLGWKATTAITLAGYQVDQSGFDRGLRNYGRVNPSVNLNYRSGKINLFANTSYNVGNSFSTADLKRNIFSEVYRNKNFDEYAYDFFNVRAGGDYYFNDKATMGTSIRSWKRIGTGSSLNKTSVLDESEAVLFTVFNTASDDTRKRSGTTYNLYYKYDFDKKKGQNLNIDFDYNLFNTNITNDLAIFNDETPQFRSLSQQIIDQPVNIIVGKADYIHPVDSTLNIETGIKTSFATVDNDLKFLRGGVLSIQESNDFLYRENINAAYINLSKNLAKIEIKAGVRAEQTIVKGTSMGVDTLNRNYIQLFPSASALYRLNQNLAIQTSYARRVNRPGFQQQNPFSNFIDSLTYTRGNPNLRPEDNHTGQLKLTYDGQPVFGISYSVTNDVIIENAPKLEGTKTFTNVENLAQNKRVEIELNFPIKIGKIIDGFGGNQAIYNAYNAEYLGNPYEASRWHWLAYWQINASLPYDFKMEFGGFYMTKFLEEFVTIDPLGGANIGISKTFADKKGRIALSWNDIFYSQNSNVTIDFQDIQLRLIQREFTRNLRLTCSYTFGNTKVKNAQTRSSASEAEASRVKLD
jgi:hypothetical protein